MIETVSQLLDQIRTGDLLEHRHSNVELKQNWSQEVGKKVSSNANKIHIGVAWIVVGIKDDGSLCGHTASWAKSTEEQISGHLNQYLDPFQACHCIESYDAARGWIVVVKLGNPGVVVYWNKTAYKSAGTTIAEMTPEECMELTVSLPGLQDFSAQKWDGALEVDIVRRFLNRVAKRTTDPTLTNVGSADPASVLHRLRIKGKTVSRLLFGDATFRLIFYNAAEVPVRNEVHSPLYKIFEPQLYEEIEAWAENERNSKIRIFPASAFQEGIANAVAHAAYFERDGEIMIEVHIDRVCISNLCTHESTYFANRWFSRSHKTVNNLLMETLRLGGHVDELGRGKHLIFSDYIANGRSAPAVLIERAGRYSRWRLVLPGGFSSERHLRLLETLQDHYGDAQKALIALALVLWREKPVKEIRNYVDGESAPTFAEVLADFDGATFYYKEGDRIVLNRWARLLLHEGVDSKALSEPEEEHLYEYACDVQGRYDHGIITPAELRKLAELGHTNGAKTIASKLLSKWTKQNRVEKLKRGHYRLTPHRVKEQRSDLLELFTNPETRR